MFNVGKKFGKSGWCLETVLSVSGRCQERALKISRKCLEDIFKVPEKFLEGDWKVSENLLQIFCVAQYLTCFKSVFYAVKSKVGLLID